MERLDLQYPIHHPETTPAGVFLSRALEHGYPYVVVDDWATTGRTVGEVSPLLQIAAAGREHTLFELRGALVQTTVAGGRAYATAAAADHETVARALETLRTMLPVADPTSAHEVTVTFWTYGRHGPDQSWRSIAVPEWSEIRDNYSASTRASLEPIMHGFEPARGGQLILWHGNVGTGKTFALRALAWEWRNWCDLHYIVDPDSFFGEHADYLMSVLLQPGYEEMHEHFEDGVVAPGMFAVFAHAATQQQARRPWRLLILEDTGELLTPDAKAVIGQGLSRFLNVVDGLIGQGLRVLVLVTTNEPIRKLHEAVARPGRCAANIEFVPLSRDEAAAWLEERGGDTAVDSPMTLASLYARLAGVDAEGLPAPGFAG